MEKKTALNIYQRLSAIMSAVGNVPKNGWNSFNKYKFVQESDVADCVREACLLHGVMVIPQVVDHSTIETQTKQGDRSVLTTVRMLFSFVNIDNPEDAINVSMIGQGQDNQDKGSNKAITGATKYCYLKLFNIGTGDDAEHDSKDHAPATPYAQQGKQVMTYAKATARQEKGLPVQMETPPPITDADVAGIAFSLDDDTPDFLRPEPVVESSGEEVFHYKPPYNRKDEIKSMGAKWNGEKKTWDSIKRLSVFESWLEGVSHG